MKLTDNPSKISIPFADSGTKSSIPNTSQIGIADGRASWPDGFPPLTLTPIESGGHAPYGEDVNGVLNAISAIGKWLVSGGGFPYDSSFATDTNVAGYPKGARVLRSDGLGYWLNTADDNQTDPEGGSSANWVPEFAPGIASVTMTSSNVTLTPIQYGKPIISITGTLTANLNLVFPSIPGVWAIFNGTTGNYTITAKTSSGTGVSLGKNDLIISNGTDFVSPNKPKYVTDGQDPMLSGDVPFTLNNYSSGTKISIGPTGSGATITVSALDNYTGYAWVDIRVLISMDGTASNTKILEVHAAKHVSGSFSVVEKNRVVQVPGNTTKTIWSGIKVPVDKNSMFDMEWFFNDSSAESTLGSIIVYIVGVG